MKLGFELVGNLAQKDFFLRAAHAVGQSVILINHGRRTVGTEGELSRELA